PSVPTRAAARASCSSSRSCSLAPTLGLSAAPGGAEGVGLRGDSARSMNVSRTPTMNDAMPLLAARILVVDDEAPNVLLLKRALEQQGYQNVRTTSDSRDVAETIV